MSEKRIVLVKPGDILIFGNVGPIDPEDLEHATAKLREAVGIDQIFFFGGDIDMDLVPA